MYSNLLPHTMITTSPAYTIKMEPIFFDHLLLHLNKNKKIRVVLVNGSLEGMLTGVAIDHLQLTIDGENYHVRYPQVVDFKKAG
jgi:hypothetical protein